MGTNQAIFPAPAQVGQIRVILIEDNRELLETLAEAVRRSPALNLLGCFTSAEDALQAIQTLKPQVAVADLHLPGIDGVALTAALKRSLPQCEVLVLTVFDDADTILRALKAGATGYLIKGKHIHRIVEAILEVWDGSAPMSAAIARKVVESFHSGSHSVDSSLSSKEESILRLLAQGKLNKEIADTMGIALTTVRFHLKNIYQKLHVSNRTEAALKYLRKS